MFFIGFFCTFHLRKTFLLILRIKIKNMVMKKIIYIILAITLILPVSCELFDEGGGGLTTEQIIEGLKTALIVGTDSSTTILSATNGYYHGGSLIKIPLPPEAEAVRNTINGSSALSALFNNSTYSLDDKFEDIIKSVNHAASDAAKEAAPIFKNSINNLTISDARDILKGINPAARKKSTEFDSTAATNYFKSTTFEALTDLYSEPINTSLDKPLVGNVSATDTWSALTGAYNTALNSPAGQTAVNTAILFGQINEGDMPTDINRDLGEFCVGKALNGLFHKVGETEKKIRRDPLQWALTAVGDILELVFG